MTRATGKVNPSYALDEPQRKEIAFLVHTGLWTKTSIAESFGVTRKTVRRCHEIYFGKQDD